VRIRSAKDQHGVNDADELLWSGRHIRGRAQCGGMISYLIACNKLTSSQRGIHNIENELVFRSNPGFVFHDSRGFEAGGIAELNAVKMFIAERSKTTTLRDQLHVIW
jgi:hypothetical protein